MSSTSVSPAASGPAGAQFEVQVGADYLLAMLTGSEPRGLPGTAIERVEFQRSGAGRPLDDVIVFARDERGNPAVLEVQVKRTVAFSASDSVFSSVVGQIVQASRRSDFWSQRYELAVAIAKTSKKIEGAYQDVLTWARALGNYSDFYSQLSRPGAANSDMRAFVQTFTQNATAAGLSADQESIWKLLRRLQILVFDYSSIGSACAQLARERATRALAAEEAHRAGDLWAHLIDLTLRLAANAGSIDRQALVAYLGEQGLTLAELRHYSTAMARASEHSSGVLADISDKVGDTRLCRHERLALIRDALDRHRYVEIRGDAGVGKSGLIKHLADQVSKESRILALSPLRTPGGGWSSLASTWGFSGTARELIVELAGGGGGIIFIDNLDFFGVASQRTVVDLIRAATLVPGVAVVVTARSNFGVEEPSWIPMDSVAALGGCGSVVIDQLGESEISELSAASPRLAPLLSDSNPAIGVTRNLFRLGRLASLPSLEDLPRSEEEMVDWWWRSADGAPDGVPRRERARVLRSIAEQALARADTYSVANEPPSAIEGLLQSETLRDVGNDRVTFRHDVLREWAISSVLRAEPGLRSHLVLTRTAPPDLARSIELLSRMLIGLDSSAPAWLQVLAELSANGAHGSWRRSALLSLVRSESGGALLVRASEVLLANEGTLLRELIRTVKASEVVPASEVYGEALARLPSPAIPFNVPRVEAWARVIAWLLGLGERLPGSAIPDAISFFGAWSLGLLGQDPLTPALVRKLHNWLVALETGRRIDAPPPASWPFDGSLEGDEVRRIEEELRSTFFTFAWRAPEAAAGYLNTVTSRVPRYHRVVEEIMRFSGTLPQAAPDEIARLTKQFLIPEPEEDDDDDEPARPDRNPFGVRDHTFFPIAPTNGPFLELLNASPQVGLRLVRDLIDHAVDFYSDRQVDQHPMEIALPDCARRFRWEQSYGWSRQSAGANVITSVLMALEVWAHRQVENGRSVDDVVADIVGAGDPPCCYLLLVVDVLLSHWPASRDAAVPFLASPELLCLDHTRAAMDVMPVMDILGLGSSGRTAAASASVEALANRPSRGVSLLDAVSKFATTGTDEARDRLAELLRLARERLGPYAVDADLSDPEFMVSHALNLINAENWRDVLVEVEGSSPRPARSYQAPEPEESHLAALRAASEAGLAEMNMQASLRLALNDSTRSSAAFAAAAVEWARADRPAEAQLDSDWMRDEAIVTAALLLMRDGDAGLRAQHADWAQEVFERALQEAEDSVHRVRQGLQFNKKAIAFAGKSYALRDSVNAEGARELLIAAASTDPAVAHGFGAALASLQSSDPRLPTSVLRCAFWARLYPYRSWNTPDDTQNVRAADCLASARSAVEREIEWLFGNAPAEPAWPTFPSRMIRVRQPLRIRGGRATRDAVVHADSPPTIEVDQQGAALWLGQVLTSAHAHQLLAVVRAYSGWTAAANGRGEQASQDVENAPSEWNDAYFSALAITLGQLSREEVRSLVVEPIVALSDDGFFEVASTLIRGIDAAYFGDHTVGENVAVPIRAELAERLIQTRSWQRLRSDRSDAVEIRSSPTIATFFFNDRTLVSTRAYLGPLGIERVDPFLPTLQRLVRDAPSLYSAMLSLNLLEVAPRSRHLQFMLSLASTWLEAFPTSIDFWIGAGIGRRMCRWLDAARSEGPPAFASDAPHRSAVDHTLAAFVSLGIGEAASLERILTAADIG